MHALSGVRALDPSNRASADLRIRPHGLCDRPASVVRITNKLAALYDGRATARTYFALLYAF